MNDIIQTNFADSFAATTVMLHADDLGMNQAVNAGILRGFTHGLLTSTSLLANAPAAESALADWSQLQTQQSSEEIASSDVRRRLGETGRPFDLGIHLNLTQGYPLSGAVYPDELRTDDGRFCGIGQAFLRLHRRRHRFTSAITDELTQQIEFLLDHGQTPSHLNGHQYVELLPGLADIVPRLIDRYRIPVVRVAREPGWLPDELSPRRLAAFGLGRIKWLFARKFQQRVARLGFPHPAACFGTCHAGRIGLPELRRFLNYGSLPSIVEIVMHPGDLAATEEFPRGAAWHDPLADGRPQELSLLQSEELVTLLESRGCRLSRLSDLARNSPSVARQDLNPQESMAAVARRA